MSVSVNCADYGSLDQSADRAVRADPGRQALIALAVLCDQWSVEPAGPAFNEPVDSQIPALVLAGVFDPATPPESTAAVADVGPPSFNRAPATRCGDADTTSLTICSHSVK
jgi:hypothetical protein